MGKLFIPMSTTHPHHCQAGRPMRGLSRCPVSVYQPSLLDAIISGVLRQLQVEESAANQGEKQTMGKRTRLPWVHTVNMKGFQPGDISVKVEDHTVHIAAKHLTETAAGRDVIERYRQVQLPEDVDVEKLNCFLDESGKLIMKAPVAVCHQSKKCMETSNVECCRNTPNIKMDRQGEEKSEKRDNEDNEDLPSKHRDGNQAGYHPTDTEHTNCNLRDQDVHLANKSDSLLTCLQKEENDIETQSKRKDEENDLLTDADRNVINTDELTNEQSFENVEDHVSLPNSPQESIEFLIYDKDGEETPTDVKTASGVKTTTADHTVEITTDNTLDIKDQDTDNTHPVMDSTRVRDIDGKKQFEIIVNLQHFKPENTSIRYKDCCLQIDASKEVETDSLTTYQKIHREFTLPKQGVMDGARASMNNDGLLRVTVPLHMDI